MHTNKNQPKKCEDDGLVFCQNILALRKKYQLTQVKMAELLGISIKSLRSLERGKIPPKLSCKILFNIYEVFGVFPGDMFSPLKN